MIRRAAVLTAFLFAPTLFAQTYIVPARDCGAVTFNVARGTAFPSIDQKVSADRIAGGYVHLLRQRVALKLGDGTAPATFHADVPAEGVVMATVSLKPQIEGKETRTEYAKAFVFCGPKAPQADWQIATGLGLELIPQGWNGPRPSLKPGDPMRFIAIYRDKHFLQDVPMELYGAGGGLIATGQRAKDGGMNFPYQKPGHYMVVATYRRADPQQPEHWLVDTSTLTFDIK